MKLGCVEQGRLGMWVSSGIPSEIGETCDSVEVIHNGKVQSSCIKAPTFQAKMLDKSGIWSRKELQEI